MQHIKDIAQSAAEKLRSGHTPRTFADAPRHGRQIERRTLSELDTTNPTVMAAVEMCHRWAERKRAGYMDASLVFCGPVGTGKTHIAKALLWSMSYTLEDGTPVGYPGRFFVASDLMMLMNPTRSEIGMMETPRPSSFIGNAPMIVIDDLGTEQSIPFIKADEQKTEIQARYFRVIDYCYQWQTTMVITSNLSIKQLQDYLGPRNWDRLGQMAPAGFMIDLTGVPSWRKKESGRI